jgi:hypothetical protein
MIPVIPVSQRDPADPFSRAARHAFGRDKLRRESRFWIIRSSRIMTEEFDCHFFWVCSKAIFHQVVIDD